MIKVEYINEQLNSDKEQFIKKCEDESNQKYEKIADEICKNKGEKPFIFISGPSGSGKTTSAIKLYNEISKRNIPTCYISMDKYFKNFTDEERSLKKQNKIDLESPDRIDTDFLSCELQKLMNNEKIFVPDYSFVTNTRVMTEKALERKNGLVIVEGIHALNPDVLNEDDISTRIYVSVRSRLIDPESDKLHPCKVRLLRRMLRDKMFRGRSIEETTEMFPRVQRGENSFIMPYKYRSSFDIDTFIPFEPCIYKHYLFDELVKLKGRYADLRDIVEALDLITPMEESGVPGDSLVREFIGNSTLKY